MKNKKIYIYIASCLALIGLVVFLLLHFLNNNNKLTVSERKWIDKNINTIQNVNVVNDANVFGNNGQGVFYDFLNDFSDKYYLEINPITFSYGTEKSGITFTLKNNVSDNDVVFYEDHYVLISTNASIINKNENLSGKKIGVLSSDLNYISNYIKENVTFNVYSSRDEMLTSITSNDYLLVPMFNYLDVILTNNYEIVYHFSDIKSYYVMETVNDNLSGILTKYFNTWKEDLEEYKNEEEYQIFLSSLKISENESVAIKSKTYEYGFVNASPYEVIKGGSYGGVIGVLLKEFSDFSSVEFNFVKYKNYKSFVNALNDNKIDIYFNHYNLTNDYKETTTGFINNYVVVANKKNDLTINSLYSLIGKEVYVEQNSKLYDYLVKISGVSVKTYANEKELSKLNRKNVIIFMDINTFNYFDDNKLNNYTIRYEGNLNDSSKMKLKSNSPLYTLFNRYIETLDQNELLNKGVSNHYETMKNGLILEKIAKYIIVLIILIGLGLYFFVKKSKKITISKKIKKDDKLKFIDQLTSLKNRNYLNECTPKWNNNTIYPQTIIVIDLNNVQKINDQYGYNEGDRQIKSLANALIKTQLDNSEIMRTDGNEFVIYLIGYSLKQVTNYLHKLNKEIDKLPYENGARIGYSMIEDDLKTIEDALNESTKDIKEQKNKNEK